MLFRLFKKPKHPNINIEFLINYDKNKKFYLNGKFLFDEKTFKKYESRISFYISYSLDQFSNDFNIKNFKIDPNFSFYVGEKNHFGFRMNLFKENDDFLSILPSIYFDLGDSEITKKSFLNKFVNCLNNFERRTLIVNLFEYQKNFFSTNCLYDHSFILNFIEKYNKFLNIDTLKISYEKERISCSYYCITIHIGNNFYSINRKDLSEKTDMDFVKLLFEMKIITLPYENIKESEIEEILHTHGLLNY